jgi:cysteinyl-tRNA synthetase
MSMKYLGETLDIHGGGLENAFPHHECEIAQSEAATGRPFVRYWIHNNMVTVNGTKMGKSLGNFVTLKELFQRHHPQHVRFLVLSSHYRHPLDFSEQSLTAAARGHERLMQAWRLAKEKCAGSPLPDLGTLTPGDTSPLRSHWEEGFLGMDDDFNTPRALAALFEVSKLVNKAHDDDLSVFPFHEALALFSRLGGEIMGLRPIEDSKDGNSAGLIQLLLDVRLQLRKNKNWELSDVIRDRMKSLGYEIQDTAEGSRCALAQRHD